MPAHVKFPRIGVIAVKAWKIGIGQWLALFCVIFDVCFSKKAAANWTNSFSKVGSFCLASVTQLHVSPKIAFVGKVAFANVADEKYAMQFQMVIQIVLRIEISWATRTLMHERCLHNFDLIVLRLEVWNNVRNTSIGTRASRKWCIARQPESWTNVDRLCKIYASVDDLVINRRPNVNEITWLLDDNFIRNVIFA